jgi:hypothetical protein
VTLPPCDTPTPIPDTDALGGLPSITPSPSPTPCAAPS